MDIKNFLQGINEDLQRMGTNVAKLYWGLTTTGDPSYGEAIEKAEIEMRLYLSDKERFEMVQAFMGQTSDEIEKRELRLLFQAMLPNQLPRERIEATVRKEVEIESIFTNFRAKIDDREVSNNEITEILEKSNDTELRKKAWIAGKAVGERIAPILIELIKTRNENAKILSFNNHYDMMMELQELSTEQIHSMFNEFKKNTDDLFTEIKGEIDRSLAEKFGVERSEIYPWHYSDLWFQEVPEIDDYDYNAIFKDRDIVELTRRTYELIGLDISDILERSDLYERKGKNQHAFTISIDRERDVRVLANIRPSIKEAGTMLHEFGHAVYDKYIDKTLPFILREPAHIFTTEAIAMLFERNARDPEWYDRVVNLSESEIIKFEEKLSKLHKFQLAILSRWVIAFVFFEKELYKDPEGDLNNLWYDTLKELQYINPPEERRNYPDWAAKIHFGTSPVYYHNYLLGEMLASQLKDFIKNNVSENLLNKNTGEYLVEEIFRKGSRYRWDELIERATGKPLTPTFLIEDIK